MHRLSNLQCTMLLKQLVICLTITITSSAATSRRCCKPTTWPTVYIITWSTFTYTILTRWMTICYTASTAKIFITRKAAWYTNTSSTSCTCITISVTSQTPCTTCTTSSTATIAIISAATNATITIRRTFKS